MSTMITFDFLPETIEEFMNIPESGCRTPYEVAAMTVLACLRYVDDPVEGEEMLNVLKGPKPLNAFDKQFLRDRLTGKDYVPRSYLKGTSPENDYEPSKPYVIEILENPYSFANDGSAKLYIRSSGADSPRPIVLRQNKDGTWYLFENLLLADIRKPESFT
ncbi:MAG: hypothetical protein GX939_08975 [Clostridiaceae bacterium]|jgi:hypothetical protein|nr:hypothetical protein [Clostridiaceae bacterium]